MSKIATLSSKCSRILMRPNVRAGQDKRLHLDKGRAKLMLSAFPYGKVALRAIRLLSDTTCGLKSATPFINTFLVRAKLTFSAFLYGKIFLRTIRLLSDTTYGLKSATLFINLFYSSDNIKQSVPLKRRLFFYVYDLFFIYYFITFIQPSGASILPI